ncbi:E3 ubiquitin-protein ligase TRIM39-like [Aplochiton taeniatus]
MASPGGLWSEKPFQCPVCQDVLTDPVTTPCGHNICQACLSHAWDNGKASKCPACENTFPAMPEISVNTAFKEITDQYRRMTVGFPTSNSIQAEPGEVTCDVCTGPKLKALKSCLVCLTSYCETHLEPHQRVSTLKIHKLIEPVEDLETRMCKKHQRLLELFCRDDQRCVCQFCGETEHKTHRVRTIEEESKEKKIQMSNMADGFQQMIQTRLHKMEEIKHSVELSRTSSKKEALGGAQLLASLAHSIEKIQTELGKEIDQMQKAAESRADRLVGDLEREIGELRRRSTELEQLSHTEDHLDIVQSFSSLSSPPPTKNWSETSVHSELCVGTVRKAVSKLLKKLEKKLERLKDEELKKIQKYTVDVILDPDTAHPNIVLSADGKQAGRGDLLQILPDIPQRFDPVLCVLGKRGFSSGRFYFQVAVGTKTFWDVGVVRESVTRKGMITSTPDNGYWTVRLRGGDEYRALESPSVLLRLNKKPQEVGVFVDYDEGTVSFYDVEDRSHIYSFTGFRFTENLYPFLSPSISDDGRNSSPLVISPAHREGEVALPCSPTA